MSLPNGFKNNEKVESEDPNTMLRNTLKNKVEKDGHTVFIEDGIVFIGDQIGILIEYIENPNLHPFVMQVGIRTVVQDYFDGGISEILVGIGETIAQKAESAVNNYLTVTFPVILQSMSDLHNPNLDMITNQSRQILWHPTLGQLSFQGKWENYPDPDYLFELLKDWLAQNMVDRKFNWLKLYLAKQADGSITGDCSLNNNFREDGYRLLEKYAQSWSNQFQAVKEFIIVRRCDKCDEVE